MEVLELSILTAAIVVCCQGQTGTDLKNLKTLLFTTNTYNTNVRPKTDQEQTVTVTVDYALVGINDLSDTDQQLTTTGFLTLKWTDELLVWTPATYGNLQSILAPQNNVWKPDIALDNGMESKTALGQKFIQVTVTYLGRVTWSPYQVFITSCSLDISHFPFDKQTCDVKFSTWMNPANNVNLTLGTSGFTTSNFEKNGKWSVESMAATSEHTSTKSTIIFTLNLKRKPSFYIMFLILPAVLLALLNAFVFVLPAGSGEKVGYTITVFLSYAIFYTILSESLPKNSDTVSTVGAYLFLMMLLSALGSIVTVAQIRLYDRDEKIRVPNWVIRFVKFVLHRRCLCVCCANLDDLDADEDDDWTKVISPWRDVTWKDFVDALDFVLFWVLVVFIFFCTILLLACSVSNVKLF